MKKRLISRDLLQLNLKLNKKSLELSKSTYYQTSLIRLDSILWFTSGCYCKGYVLERREEV